MTDSGVASNAAPATNTPVWGSADVHITTTDGHTGEVHLTIHQVASVTTVSGICSAPVVDTPHQVVRVVRIDISSEQTSSGQFSSDTTPMGINVGSSVQYSQSPALYSDGFVCGNGDDGGLETGLNTTAIAFNLGDSATFFEVWSADATPANPQGFTADAKGWNGLYVDAKTADVRSTGSCSVKATGSGWQQDGQACGVIYGGPAIP